MKRGKWTLSSIVGVFALALVGAGSAAANVGTWGSLECESTNHYCCSATAMDTRAWTYLLYDSNADGAFPMSITSNSSFKVRSRAKCSSGGSWITASYSTDNNCGSGCEISQHNACPSGGVYTSQCRIDNQ